MLSSPIPAYLYRQYAGDDDLQSIVDAYNAAAQYYQDWFNGNPLAYYPALSGPLLDWVAEGLYGQARTTLASPFTAVLGPLNSVTFDALVFNGFIPSSNTSYAISDDIFKRILTWNFYKGDGKRFSMRWIKRRIMRFILGVDGIAPQPGTPGFVVGVENSLGVNVAVASNVLTVTLNQGYLSSITQLTPGILTFFKLAFLGGVLELPAQYTYEVSILTTLGATASPSSVSTSGAGSTQTTPAVTIIPYGGSGSYTYSAAWSSGGTDVSIDSPTSAVSTFTGSSMSPGLTYGGTAEWTVTDTVTLDTTTVLVDVAIARAGTLTATASPTALTVSDSGPTLTTANVTVTPAGGTPPYTHAWTLESGASPGVVIGSPAGNVTDFSASGVPTATTLTATALDTVTDSLGETAPVTCAVTLYREVKLGVLNSVALNTTALNDPSSAPDILLGLEDGDIFGLENGDELAIN